MERKRLLGLVLHSPNAFSSSIPIDHQLSGRQAGHRTHTEERGTFNIFIVVVVVVVGEIQVRSKYWYPVVLDLASRLVSTVSKYHIIMVSIRKAKQGFQVRRKKRGQYDREKIGLVAGGLCIGVLIVVMYNSMGGMHRELPPDLRQTKPHPHLSVSESQPLSDSYNAVALEILNLLDCEALFNASSSNTHDDPYNYDPHNYDPNSNYNNDNNNNNNRRRRLEDSQHGDDGGFGGVKQKGTSGGDGNGDDNDNGGDPNRDEEMKEELEQNGGMDDYGGGWGDNNWNELTAKHLFCAAAVQTPPSTITTELKCDAAGTKRQTLLDLWSAARAQMSEPLFLKTLDLAKEHASQILLGREYNLWAPSNDNGLSYMLNSFTQETTVDLGGLRGLQENLGVGKLFVDVGSCLGITTLAITNLYPGTKIVSLEPASPNWLLQEMNLRCNLPHKELLNIHVVLAGVGPNNPEEDNMMAKLMWRPTATTSTRAWTPATEHAVDDVELVVRLRRLKSILAEADVYGIPIDVLNVDCEGCEYNLLPALSEEEFDAIPTVMGTLHWGYIPTNKLPSSERAKMTHERLCQHENIARTAKECCAFPTLQVKSSVPGEILLREQDNKSVTVADVAEELCDGFDQWAIDHYLHDVQNDWGWFELTSQA